MIRLITAGDRKLMLRLNRWEAPHWIRNWMLFASRGGDGWLWSTIGLILLLFGGARRFDALGAGFVLGRCGSSVMLLLSEADHRP